MNLELIIKLIRLANNNPNDNEANVAARRACKMLAEDDCKFLLGKSVPITDPAHSGFTSQWYKESYDKYANYRQANPINRCIKCGNETQVLVQGYCINCILERSARNAGPPKGDPYTNPWPNRSRVEADRFCIRCKKKINHKNPNKAICNECEYDQGWPKVCYYCTKLIEKHQQYAVNREQKKYYHYNCYGKDNQK